MGFRETKKAFSKASVKGHTLKKAGGKKATIVKAHGGGKTKGVGARVYHVGKGGKMSRPSAMNRKAVPRKSGSTPKQAKGHRH